MHYVLPQQRLLIGLAILMASVQLIFTSAPARTAQNARAASNGDGASLPRGASSIRPGEPEAPVEYDRLRTEGNRAIYNLDYAGAGSAGRLRLPCQ